MNKQRRKLLDNLSTELNDIKERLEVAHVALCDIRDAEQEYVDNLPENKQDSEAAETAYAAIESMESGDVELDDVLNELGQAISLIDGLAEQFDAVIERVEEAQS